VTSVHHLFIARPLVSTAVAISTGLYAFKVFYADPEAYTTRHNPKPNRFLSDHFVFSKSNLDAGRWYTFLTSTFYHEKLLDFALNAQALWTFGNLLVPMIGPVDTAFLYIGSAFIGRMLSLNFRAKVVCGERERGSIDFGYYGARTSVVALMATLLVLLSSEPDNAEPFTVMLAWLNSMCYGTYVCVALTSEISQMHRSSRSYLGVVGGLVFGAAYGFLRLERVEG